MAYLLLLLLGLLNVHHQSRSSFMHAVASRKLLPWYRNWRACRIKARIPKVCFFAIIVVYWCAPSAFAQNIQVTPAALSATVVKGQSTTLVLNLQKTGTEQHIWEPKTSVNWISLSPAYGSSNTITTERDTVQVGVNTANMALGTNSGLVYIWESGPGFSRLISVPVTITVSQTGTTTSPPPPPPASPPPASPSPASPPPASPPPATPPPPSPPAPPPSSLSPNITVFPAALSATVVKGQSTTLVLNLQKTGTEQHIWEPKTSVNWISLSPAYGSSNTITTERDTVQVGVNTANMALGTNSGLVYIWESGPGFSRLISVPVTITVSQTGTTTSPPPPPPASPPASPSPASPPPASPPPATPPPPSPPAPPPSSLNPNITAFPAALSATVVKGQSTTLVLNLQKTGTEQHIWEPKTSVNWISLSPAYGSSNTITTELDTVQVGVNTANMALGTNSGLVYIWESGPGFSRLISVPVTITVSQTGTTTSPPPPPPASPPPASPPPASPPPAPSSMGTATVTWAANSEADLAGYKLYIGTASGIYNRIIDLGNVTSYTVALTKGVTYFFAVTAYDKTGNESSRSAELSRSIF